MPIDPFAALNALIRAEVARSARPVDDRPPAEDREPPGAEPEPAVPDPDRRTP
ncbi:hypothetical protein I3J09_03535 [Streptomyces clavuligerus]|uniref:hypothetical protein n=1 Tax=Streptomyces clavuligerus TaxID=1901 RepID=UPI00020D9527|nr:hypothetical protein [Streptomyces clavuligerus]MBY6301748.1 hypothetical protein [Streptomyces clavuligerus]QPL62007.1 hypothetical protein I3J04_03520 [Streptomyces clavuligerus]QPL68040.1 hypothetical protein I3J05_03535 [Streptomyces clavuligerus]QPL73477.1 hypothetical protein I3J05_31225 [Streptomyces clavuligerus]QPL74116.1 hypothetical protein I3J06_03530 [Streptomyces clavuligerus]